MNSSTKEQANDGPSGVQSGEQSSTIQEIMRSVRNIQQDMDSKLKNMEEKIQRFLDNLDDDHYERDNWSDDQAQQEQQHQQNVAASKSHKEQQQGTLTQ